MARAAVRKISVTASASGSGKTTVARELARRLGVQFIELDVLVHGPNWTETPDDELRRLLAPTLALDGWVIDGGYRWKLGDLVLSQADAVVWLDLPIRVWLPRLVRRTVRRVRGSEEIFNGNRESVRTAVWGREALIPSALRTHFSRRRHYPTELDRYHVVRLRTQADVDRFVSAAGEP